MFGYLLESLQVISFASKLDKGNKKYLILSHYGNAVAILKTTEQHFVPMSYQMHLQQSNSTCLFCCSMARIFMGIKESHSYKL